MCRVQAITSKGFEAYGRVLEFTENCNEPFEIIMTEKIEPWRIAMFRYKNKTIKKMENHPFSQESFEPVSGVTILVVAEHEHPEQYKAFILNQPVCLYKGIWHQVLSLTEEASVKITENLEVTSEFYELKKEITVEMQ